MNSFEDLNDYSDDQLAVPDERPFSIVYADDTTQDYNITIDEGATHVVPVPIDISDMTSVQDVTYTITFSGDLLTGVDVDNGYYTQLSSVEWTVNVESLSFWELIKSPTIFSPPDATNYSYIVELRHPVQDDGSTIGKIWQVNVTVNDANEITTPTDSDYDEDFPGLITGYPQVTNLEDTNPSSSYTVEVYPASTADITSLSSAGSGGSSSFNSGTKKLTLVGSRTQVNSHLAAITLTPAPDVDYDFIIYYRVTNPISALQTTVSQWLRINAVNQETSNLGINRDYDSNKFNLLFPTDPIQIIENTYGTPTYTIMLTLGASIGEISLYGDSSGWDSATKTYSFTGTKDQCNLKLTSLYFKPPRDSYTSSTLRYRQYKETLLQSDDTVTFTGHNVAFAGSLEIYTTKENGLSHSVEYSYEKRYYGHVDILVIGGGGMGGDTRHTSAFGYDLGGGGGAGGIIYLQDTNFFKDAPTDNFSVSPGLAAGTKPSNPGTAYQSTLYGGPSVVSLAGGYNSNFYLYAPGGGIGGYYFDGQYTKLPGYRGAGGGGGSINTITHSIKQGGARETTWTYTPTWLGYAGGSSGTSPDRAGGGGGAGSAGSAGNAGAGYACSITGSSVTYSVGGRPGKTSAYGTSAANTYGSGGDGGINTSTSSTTTVVSGSFGQMGAVIIKFY